MRQHYTYGAQNVNGLLIGGAGTVAAVLYNPCGCCGGPPSSGTLKTVRAPNVPHSCHWGRNTGVVTALGWLSCQRVYEPGADCGIILQCLAGM